MKYSKARWDGFRIFQMASKGWPMFPKLFFRARQPNGILDMRALLKVTTPLSRSSIGVVTFSSA